MKVIFVDVDGVLNSDDFIDSVKGKQDIDIKTVLLLRLVKAILIASFS